MEGKGSPFPNLQWRPHPIPFNLQERLCWKKFALQLDRPDAEAIFLSCGGIRSLEVAHEIEKITGKPVITSNQAQFWSCLRRAGIKDKLVGFGKIFQENGLSLKKNS